MGGFKLGLMTLKSLFSKPVTEQYPTVPHQYYDVNRGRVKVSINDCTFCGTCANSCPAETIAVDRAAYTWSINRYQCVQCGSCVMACPTHCLSMEHGYAASAQEKHIDVYGLTLEAKEAREAEARARKERAAKLREEAAAKKKAEAAAAAAQGADA